MTHTNECLHCGLELNLVVDLVMLSCAQSPSELHQLRILNGEILAYQGKSSTNMRFESLPRKEEERQA